MKRTVLLLTMLFGRAASASAATPASLTTLRDVAALTNAQASQHLRVSFEATVNYVFRPGLNMDVQDGDVGIYVKTKGDFTVVPGDRVLVEGATEPSFLPYVKNATVRFLRHVHLPEPRSATFDDLIHKNLNCRLVRVRGVIRTADIVPGQDFPTERLQLLMDGGYVDVHVNGSDAAGLKSLLDTEVEVTGAAGRLFDGKMQQTGAKMKLSSLSDIRVIRRAAIDPWTLPVTPLGEVITGYHVHDRSERMRVHGTITYYAPGSAAVLENDTSSLWISTHSNEPIEVGDVADAIGFPTIDGNRLSLVHAEIADRHILAPVPVREYDWNQLALWARNSPTGHQYDLVSIKGRVITEVREAAQDDYVLVSDGRLFTAIYRHPPEPRPLPAMLQVPVGSMVLVTGICLPIESTAYNEEAPFNILLRSFDDIAIVSHPPWLNVRHLILMVGTLLIVVICIGIRSWFLERRVRHRTAALAYLERRRSRILEDINNTRPLSEILEQITEVVSFRLHGAACWCQVADGARLGDRPEKITSQRLIQREIPGRSGASLGTIYAAIHRLKKPCPEESDALSLGSNLAAIAIETSRLYSDLVHRSEFDRLTDIPNRFSLEKLLEGLVHDSARFAGIFALIFIDLDRFKQVNDQFGHLAGDLYLQQAALRMKRELRPADTLARLGGDEFAVVVPAVRNRDDVQEIALRLERCFDLPFPVEDHELHGSASVGVALYPDDGATADALLSRADAAMYAVKQSRQRGAPKPEQSAQDLAHCA